MSAALAVSAIKGLCRKIHLLGDLNLRSIAKYPDADLLDHCGAALCGVYGQYAALASRGFEGGELAVDQRGRHEMSGTRADALQGGGVIDMQVGELQARHGMA